jgi:hypothetical protein
MLETYPYLLLDLRDARLKDHFARLANVGVLCHDVFKVFVQI